jgi:hypothetical protein
MPSVTHPKVNPTVPTIGKNHDDCDDDDDVNDDDAFVE